MPVPATFLEFLAEMPDGPSGHGMSIYARVDTMAGLIASRYAAEGRTADSLRALADQQMEQATTRTGRWTDNYHEAQRNYWRAGMCALDPKLILRPDLSAWVRCRDVDIEHAWVDWYLDLLEIYARKRLAERTGANDNADGLAPVQDAVASVMAEAAE